MELVIDVGNSFIKIAIFEHYKIIRTFRCNGFDEFKNKVLQYHFIKIILSSVAGFNDDLIYFCKKLVGEQNFIYFTHTTRTPIKNSYKTPASLGIDRLAAAVGGNYFFPDKALLLIDAGTAITFDYVTVNNEFVGGNISPGMSTRFKALNNYTAKLPLLDISNNFDNIGIDTNSAIIAGVQLGAIYEVEGYINTFTDENSHNLTPFQIILTGGDCFFFEKNLKNTIFAEPNLVFWGLKRILDYNIT